MGPESDLQEIQENIIDNKQRILPVMDGDIDSFIDELATREQAELLAAGWV